MPTSKVVPATRSTDRPNHSAVLLMCSAVGLIIATTLALPAAGQTPIRVQVPRGAQQLMLHPAAGAALRFVAPQQDSVTLQPGAILAARLGSSALAITRTDTSLRAWRLPFAYTTVTSSGEVLELYPEAEVDGGGFRVDTATGMFHGRIRLGVVDAQGRTGRPIDAGVRLFVTSDADRVDPATVRIRETGVPSVVRLVASAPAESVLVRVRSDIDTVSVALYVPVIRPRLQLSVTPATIQGLGLQAARLVVTATGLPTYHHRVSVTADRGDLDGVLLRLDADGHAETSLRSEGWGAAQVIVAGPPFAPASAPVRFAFPFAFLLAAIAGGGVGALVRKPRPPGTVAQGRVARIGRGVLVGLVVAAAYAIGVNLLALEIAARAGEALTFVISALGAYGGERVLEVRARPAAAALLAVGALTAPASAQVPARPVVFSTAPWETSPTITLDLELGHGIRDARNLDFLGIRAGFATGPMRIEAMGGGLLVADPGQDALTLGTAVTWHVFPTPRFPMVSAQAGAGYSVVESPGTRLERIDVPLAGAIGVHVPVFLSFDLSLAARLHLRHTSFTAPGQSVAAWRAGPGASFMVGARLPVGLQARLGLDWVALEDPVRAQTSNEWSFGVSMGWRLPLGP